LNYSWYLFGGTQKYEEWAIDQVQAEIIGNQVEAFRLKQQTDGKRSTIEYTL
jgi:hypothetical protein